MTCAVVAARSANCKARIVELNGRRRVFYFAKQGLAPGDELTCAPLPAATSSSAMLGGRRARSLSMHALLSSKVAVFRHHVSMQLATARLERRIIYGVLPAWMRMHVQVSHCSATLQGRLLPVRQGRSRRGCRLQLPRPRLPRRPVMLTLLLRLEPQSLCDGRPLWLNLGVAAGGRG